MWSENTNTAETEACACYSTLTSSSSSSFLNYLGRSQNSVNTQVGEEGMSCFVLSAQTLNSSDSTRTIHVTNNLHTVRIAPSLLLRNTAVSFVGLSVNFN